MSAHIALFKGIEECSDGGIVGRLGLSFARFIASFEETMPCVLFCSALLAELESRGHTCLELHELAGDPCTKFAFKNEHWNELCKHVADLPKTVAAWRQALESCPQVWAAGKPHEGQPLVLHGNRVYLRKHWQDETRIAQAVHARVTGRRAIKPERVAQILDKLFDTVHDRIDWQRVACAIAVRSTFTIITGGPGTGKTYSVASLLALLLGLSPDPARLKVAMAAPSGKAAARLQESIDRALGVIGNRIDGEGIDMATFRARMGRPQTLHSLIGLNPETRVARHKASRPLDIDVLIVDEASMAHLEMMALILDALPVEAMLIVLGDKDQLASVEAGAVLGDLCRGAEQGHYTDETAQYINATCGQTVPPQFIGGGSPLAQQVVMLRASRRFKGPIGALAMAVNAGDGANAAAILRVCTAGTLFASGGLGANQAAVEKDARTITDYFDLLDEARPKDNEEAMQWAVSVRWIEGATQGDVIRHAMGELSGEAASYAAFFRELGKAPGQEGHDAWVTNVIKAFDQYRILCAVREGKWGVSGINDAVEAEARKRKFLHPAGQWYEGRPVIVTRTDRALGVSNGDVGVCLSDPARPGGMRVYFLAGNDQVRSISAARLGHAETAFSMTVHKVQGSEFPHVAMVLPEQANPIVARELVYTGVTRASKNFTLLTPNAGIVKKAVEKTTDRTTGLCSLLDEVFRDASVFADVTQT